MPNFAVFVKGSNIHLRVEGELRRTGCFGLRYGRAHDEKAAIASVMEKAKSELGHLCENGADDAFILTVEEVRRDWLPFRFARRGFSFFPEDAT